MSNTLHSRDSSVQAQACCYSYGSWRPRAEHMKNMTVMFNTAWQWWQHGDWGCLHRNFKACLHRNFKTQFKCSRLHTAIVLHIVHSAIALHILLHSVASAMLHMWLQSNTAIAATQTLIRAEVHWQKAVHWHWWKLHCKQLCCDRCDDMDMCNRLARHTPYSDKTLLHYNGYIASIIYIMAVYPNDVKVSKQIKR